MKLLVVGSGGREHALAWKLAQSPKVDRVLLAPGNPGAAEGEKLECVGISAADFSGIAGLCEERGIGLVVVGPDQALADGLVDFLSGRGIAAFGPVKAAAKLESSKAFAKEVMAAAGIPTARFEVITDFIAGQRFLANNPWPTGYVVKADGLALGKGVVVCANKNDAEATLKDFLSGAMGAAGKTIVLEERLEGPEVSAFHLCDGKNFRRLGFACDYKRLQDGNEGPNTGGMGCYSPADWLSSKMAEEIESSVVAPLLAEMNKRGVPYKGVVFTGLMITKTGAKVLEFNARFGDPETQTLMPLLAEDLLPWLEAAVSENLAGLPKEIKKHSGASVHVVKAAAGYPASPRKGDAISLPTEFPEGTELFFAGVSKSNSGFVTNGGRVLGITALGGNRAEARERAYAGISQVKFAGAQTRQDIGK
jgi:phosphoribosylamine--glycine ligase